MVVIDCKSILISGGIGLGKIMFLNVVSSFVFYKEWIVMIEDMVELKLY